MSQDGNAPSSSETEYTDPRIIEIIALLFLSRKISCNE